jgi:hypothetical protein
LVNLDAFEMAPRAAATDDLGLEQADDALDERVVVAVSDTADRWLGPGSTRCSV